MTGPILDSSVVLPEPPLTYWEDPAGDFQTVAAAFQQNIESGFNWAQETAIDGWNQVETMAGDAADFIQSDAVKWRAGGTLEVTKGGLQLGVGADTLTLASAAGPFAPLVYAYGGGAIIHGADDVIEGAQEIWSGKNHDSFTMQGLQAWVGLDRETAQEWDDYLSVGFTLGGAALLETPAFRQRYIEAQPNLIRVAEVGKADQPVVIERVRQAEVPGEVGKTELVATEGYLQEAVPGEVAIGTKYTDGSGNTVNRWWGEVAWKRSEVNRSPTTLLTEIPNPDAVFANSRVVSIPVEADTAKALYDFKYAGHYENYGELLRQVETGVGPSMEEMFVTRVGGRHGRDSGDPRFVTGTQYSAETLQDLVDISYFPPLPGRVLSEAEQAAAGWYRANAASAGDWYFSNTASTAVPAAAALATPGTQLEVQGPDGQEFFAPPPASRLNPE